MATNSMATALLVMDMQLFILNAAPEHRAELDNIKTCIAAARAQGIPVMYVVLGFRNGMPEVSASHPAFGGYKAKLATADLSGMTQIHEELTPLTGDVVIVKKRFSAFAGSDLDMILRAQGIQQLVLTGVSTSGVVLSTFVEAVDKDYKLTVIADACKDRDDAVHHILTEKYFPSRGGQVVTAAEWVKTIND